jgi:hypothetical protein
VPGGASSAGASSAGSSSAGSGSAAATQVLTTTSADLVVTVDLDATKQSEAVVGEPVSVQLPDGSTVNGKITVVSPVAQSSSSSSSSGGGAASGSPSATIPVTIAFTSRRRVSGLDQAAVSVNFRQQVEHAVQAVSAAGRRTLVPVTPGLFAGGYVQVMGAGLFEGMRVTDSQG